MSNYRTDNRKYIKLLKLLAIYDTLLYQLDISKSSAAEQEQQGHKLMRQFAPEYAEVFVDATEELRDNIRTAPLVRGLAEDNPDLVMAAIPLGAYAVSLIGWTPVSVRALDATGALSAREIREQTRQAFLYDVSATNAQNYLQQHGAELVVEVTNETRQAIQSAVIRANQDGLPSRAAAREIKNIVGLTQRDATAVQNLRARMIDAGNTAAQIDSETKRMSSRLLRRRAENIARTESTNALGAGRQQAWEQAIDRGVVDSTKATKTAMAAIDNRTSLICRNVDGQTVPITAPFETLEGPQDSPAFHPSCRTTISYSARGRSLRGPRNLETAQAEFREGQKKLREAKPKRKIPKPPKKKTAA